MNTHTEEAFLRWASARGVILDPDRPYPQYARLKFESDSAVHGCWEAPVETERNLFFLHLFLWLMRPWRSVAVWQHSGSWPAEPDSIHDVAFQIMSSLGIPMGTADVLEFGQGEEGKLLTLLFLSTVFGNSVQGDLHLVPETGRYIVDTSRHGVIDVDFQDVADLDRFAKEMERRDFKWLRLKAEEAV